MMYWILELVIYFVGVLIAYQMMKKWPHAKFEKVIFSILWPLVAILYGIHWLHNKL